MKTDKQLEEEKDVARLRLQDPVRFVNEVKAEVEKSIKAFDEKHAEMKARILNGKRRRNSRSLV